MVIMITQSNISFSIFQKLCLRISSAQFHIMSYRLIERAASSFSSQSILLCHTEYLQSTQYGIHILDDPYIRFGKDFMPKDLHDGAFPIFVDKGQVLGELHFLEWTLCLFQTQENTQELFSQPSVLSPCCNKP